MKFNLRLDIAKFIFLLLLLPFSIFAQDIDSTFGINGYLAYGGVTSNTELNKGIGYGSAVQPDGKIVVTMDNADLNGPVDLFFYTYRYNVDGTPDTTFGTGGVSKIFAGDHSRGYDIQLQQDGKILVTGETKYCVNGICGASQLVLIRMNSDGQADHSFGDEGKIITSDIFGAAGSFAIPAKVNLLADGKIILGGKGIGAKPFIARLNTDGYPDLTFAQNGVYTEDIPFSQTLDVKVDQDGNSYGLVKVYNYINGDVDTINPSDILVFKLNTSGQPDNSFGVNGRQYLDFVPDDHPASIQPLDDQSIVLIGGNWITRLNADGSISSDFPSDYVVFTIPTSEPVSFKKVITLSESR